MASTLFITADAVKQRMAINPELAEVNPAVESAIRAAQLRIESEYDSKLDRSQNSDVFFLDAESFSGVRPGGVFRLQLKNAFVFVDSSNPFVVKSGSKWNSPEGELSPSEYSLDAERGILLVDEGYAEKHIFVEYTSGFLDAAETLDWVAEAILGYAPVVFNFGQTTNRNDEAEKGYKASGDHALAVLARYRRNTGFTYRPVSSASSLVPAPAPSPTPAPPPGP